MYFIDRATLGKTLSVELQDFRGKDAVILCLKKSSLMTCLTMAMELRAWVFPMVWKPIYSADNAVIPAGGVGEDGVFHLNPDTELTDMDQLTPKAAKAIADKMPDAKAAVKQEIESYKMKLDKHTIDGRDLIIAGDVITSALPIAMAQHFLTNVKPKSRTVVIGNTTAAVAEDARLLADQVNILDVLTGVVSDDHRYFQEDDAYSEEQKQVLTQHIATYWR